MNQKLRFPQGKFLDQNGYVTLEWQQWLQNPQFVTAFAGTLSTNTIYNSQTALVGVGQDGADGVDGDNGIPGVNGQPGTNGLNGVNGFDGNDGEDGIKGAPGTPGLNGRNGVNGLDGNDGEDAYPIPSSTNGYTGTITTASLVGKTVTIINGLIVSFA